jgi:polyhydroxyalkanoate synthesis regulator phasin
MTQPRTTGRRSRGSRDEQENSLREQLMRLLSPVGAMVLTRERVQEVLDDAVERGRMTRDDASELLAELVRRGRKQTDDLIESLLAAPADRVLREVDRARRATGLGPSFPISGYDDLTAAEVTERLNGLSAADLRRVQDHERRNANRKSVLTAIDRKLP